MRFWAIFASRCRSDVSCGFSFETVCGSLRSPAVAILANPAAESRRQARVRATTTQVDTNSTLL
jgi:hypothetical protein